MYLKALLADSAQVSDGKLHMLGGGWTHTQVGGTVRRLRNDRNPVAPGSDWHTLRLELLDGDGNPVCLPSEDGEAIAFDLPKYRAVIGTHVKPGSSLSWPFAVNIGPGMPLEPGTLYEWRITINDESKAGWTLPFSTMPAALADAA